MTIESWLIYVGAVLVFMSSPGPSHLLMLSVSSANGFRLSLATAVGDLTANAIQMLLAGLGLAVVITDSRYGFMIVKWAGVSYLVWLGVRQIFGTFNKNAKQSNDEYGFSTWQVLWLRGFVTSAANPKAVVFFAALFPQFLDPRRSLGPQLAVLGLTYILIDGLFLASYGKSASWLADKFRSRSRAIVERVAGAGLIVTAIMLGMRTNEKT